MQRLAALRTEERRRRPWPWAIAALLALGVGIAGGTATLRSRDVALPSPEPSRNGSAPASAAEAAELEAFVSSVAADVDAMWTRDFRRKNRSTPYVSAEPVLIDRPEKSDCGPGIAFGRLDCVGTKKAFFDRSFLHALDARFGEAATGAKAYAVAHEMGHHVQRVLGMDKKLEVLLGEKPVASHWAEVQLELQADCFAGVWSRRTQQQHLVEPTQLESSIRHTSELGTSRQLADKSGDATLGETFTYAIPRRRIYWFAQGYAHGEIDDCDTFAP